MIILQVNHPMLKRTSPSTGDAVPWAEKSENPTGCLVLGGYIIYIYIYLYIRTHIIEYYMYIHLHIHIYIQCRIILRDSNYICMYVCYYYLFIYIYLHIVDSFDKYIIVIVDSHTLVFRILVVSAQFTSHKHCKKMKSTNPRLGI